MSILLSGNEAVESLSIADEGRRNRKQAELELQNLEAELRRTLLDAGERTRKLP